MTTGKLTSRVMVAISIATITACADMLVAEAQEGTTPRTHRGVWPNNEPPGMTPILFVDGSDKNWPGFSAGGAWKDEDRVHVVSDPDSKHGSAIEKRFFIGDKDGWNGITYQGDWGLYRHQYVRMVFQFSPNFQFHKGNQKLYYWGGGNRPGKAPIMFQMFVVNGQRIEFRNNGTAGGAPEDRGSYRSERKVERGRYHTLETLHVANTPGNDDGLLRVWLDGVEITDWKLRGSRVSLENRNWIGTAEVPNGDTRLTGMEGILYWGGRGDAKRVDDWMRLSELYISGEN